MAVVLGQIQPGDEVIIPAYASYTAANAFLLRGAVLRFCEVDPYTLNMCPFSVMRLVTEKTKAIVAVHYAGIPCDIDAFPNDCLIIEDAALAIGSTYNDQPAGTLGDFGCYSFHHTNNYTMGEGGGLYVRDASRLEGLTALSYEPSEVSAALLCAQLERRNDLTNKRMAIWNMYHMAFAEAENKGLLRCPLIPNNVTHNAFMYYIVLPTAQKRDALQKRLGESNIQASPHYIPLHVSSFGKAMGYGAGDLPDTEAVAEKMLRLPLWADMNADMVEKVIDTVIHE
jgi:dTDP-4-amino-4,6-dideoxygalactose transaminase